MQKIRRFFQLSGHYLLALLCAGVILLSALWTRNDSRLHAPDAPAHADGSQRLSQVTPSPAPVFLLRPVEGAVVRSFSEEPVYFAERCCWKHHFSTDVQVNPGDQVKAAFDGTLTPEETGLRLENEEFALVYRGMNAQGASRQVKKGWVIGVASGRVHREGEGILCLTLYREGQAVDIEKYWQ